MGFLDSLREFWLSLRVQVAWETNHLVIPNQGLVEQDRRVRNLMPGHETSEISHTTAHEDGPPVRDDTK